MKPYLYAVQRESGHEVVSAVVEVKKVSDVAAQHLPDGLVRLVHEGQIIATSTNFLPPDERVTLHRWPANSKHGKPVSKTVPAPDESPDLA